MKTRIEERWDALTSVPDKPIFQLLDAEHPLDLYIGKAMTSELLFLVVDKEEPPKLKSMKAVEVATSQRPDGRWNLLLTLRRNDLSSIFALLCDDLASASRHLPDGANGMLFLARRLAAWRKLTEEGYSDLLSASEVRGLVGELLVLEQFLRSDLASVTVLKSWVGPLGADQDFHFPEMAWEVKTVPPDASSVQIASERQLYAAERALRLVVVTLGEASPGAGLSLNATVDRLRHRLQDDVEALDFLEDRLKEARYIRRAEYSAPDFHVGLFRLFRVEEGFPRLTPVDLPRGVCQVEYRVLLETCTTWSTEMPAEWN